MADFKNALLHLLPKEVRKSFDTLDAEQTSDSSRQPSDIRVEPSVDLGVQWSLSQWKGLRIPQMAQNFGDGTDFGESELPDEARQVQTIFPSFFASMNN